MFRLECDVLSRWVDRAAPEWAGRLPAAGRVPPAAAAATTAAAGPVAAAGRRAARGAAAGERLGAAKRRLCLLPTIARPGAAPAAVGPMSGGCHRVCGPATWLIPTQLQDRCQTRPAWQALVALLGASFEPGCRISGGCLQLGTARWHLQLAASVALLRHSFVSSGAELRRCAVAAAASRAGVPAVPAYAVESGAQLMNAH
jgi:hypothetical protein